MSSERSESDVVNCFDAQLHSTASTLQALPDEGRGEIALVGRSNVGKSTLLNRLTKRKKLAFTSSVPGKTQSFHSYQVSAKGLGDDEETFHLVDLPGFGYAKFAKRKREYINRLTVEYIMHRSCLRGVLLLNDIRRTPQEDELAIQRIAYESETPLVVVLTKADKVKRGELKKSAKAVAKRYNLIPEDLVVTGEKFSMSELWGRIVPLLALQQATKFS